MPAIKPAESPEPPSPAISALADRWRRVQRLAEHYKQTRDPQLREQLAGLLWLAMVGEGEIIARKTLRFDHAFTKKEVAEEVTASLLGKGMTVLLEKHDPQGGASLRTYLARSINHKLIDYARRDSRAGVNWQPAPDRNAQTLGADINQASADEPAAWFAHPAVDAIERELGQAEFWRIAREELDADTHLPPLLAYLAGMSREEGARKLGLSAGTYRSRLDTAIARLAKRFNGAFRALADDEVAG